MFEADIAAKIGAQSLAPRRQVSLPGFNKRATEIGIDDRPEHRPPCLKNGSRRRPTSRRRRRTNGPRQPHRNAAPLAHTPPPSPPHGASRPSPQPAISSCPPAKVFDSTIAVTQRPLCNDRY